MLRFALRGVYAVLFVLLTLCSSSQTTTPHTLLWRISGNGLAKPSYLYGTMHLQDKRLFQFGDSLYQALETTDGYAMEIDAREIMDSIMTFAIKESQEDISLAKQKVKLNRKKLSPSADSLLRSIGITGDHATKKDLRRIRKQRMAKLMQQGEMPTIVDAYLLGLAMRLNKWTGGIEDLSDQLNLSDELGGELEPESVLQSEATFKKSMEEMVRIYQAQNLDEIDAFINHSYAGNFKDLVLIKRNIKMAYRMDSLSHERAMFFAVGAAHLPGDSGVITLLQHRGFKVEPVFSSAKISSEVYASKLQNAEWKTVEGDENSYTVKMPGKPADYNMYGDLIKMKMYFDLTTMSFYLSGSVTGPNVSASLLDKMIKESLQNMSAKKATIKINDIKLNGLAGKEAFAENEDGGYRMRLYVKDKTVFMLMFGVTKAANVNMPEADRFFSSFIPGNTVAQKKEWETFSLKDKAFSVSLPRKPAVEKSMDEKIAESGSWNSQSYVCVDPANNFYYMVQVREINEGYFLDGDSAYFERLKEEYKNNIDEVLRTEVSTFKGYPVLYLDCYVKKADGIYKTMHVTRGNRVYTLLAGAPKGNDMSGTDAFFNSLTLLPYEPVDWSMQQGGGFITKAPSAIRDLKDSVDGSNKYSANYSSLNKKNVVSYQVFKESFSPIYWATNDSTYFNGLINHYKKYNDSLLKKEWVYNGSIKGLELVIQMPGYNTLKKVRMLVNGDTLYTIFGMLPKQDITGTDSLSFFNEFRFVKEVPPSIYTNKAAALLKALQTSDSLLFTDATENLNAVTFDKKDLPLLHQALLATYRDSTEYYPVTARIVNTISELADSTTVSFVEREYPLLKKNKEAVKYEFLSLLAKLKTAESYAVLKKLLQAKLPTSGEPTRMQYPLLDSLQLSATLYAELLQNSNDSLFGHTAVSVINRLLDSNLITKEMIKSYSQVLLQGAKKAALLLKKNQDEAWQFAEWAGVLSYLNNTEGNALLRQLITQKSIYLKQNIIVALLKNNLPVSALEINKVAADKTQRGDFYSELKKIKKESLFPAQYATQESLAESELHNYLSEDYEDFTLTYIGERVEDYGKEKKRFHLFRLRMAYDEAEKKQNFLAVAGPYNLTAKENLSYTNATGFYSDEEFEPGKLSKLLKAYLQQMKPAEE